MTTPSSDPPPALRLRGRWAVDAGLAAAFVVASVLGQVFSPQGVDWYPFTIVAGVALLWWRRVPLAMWAVVVVVMVPGWPYLGWERFVIVVFLLAIAVERPWRIVAGTVGATSLAAIGASFTWPAAPASSVSAVVALVAACVAAAAIGRSIRSDRRRADAQRSLDAAQAARLAQEARAEEAARRAALAAEVHDVVGHRLTVMVTLAEAARAAQGRDPERAAAVLGELAAVGRGAVDEIRSVIDELEPLTSASRLPALRPERDDAVAPLASLIAAVAGAMAELVRMGHPVRFELDLAAASSVASDAEAVVARIVRESVTNVLRHGPAGSPVEGRLTVHDGSAMHLRIANPVSTEAPSSPGRGVATMRSRAERLGGRLTAGRDGEDWVLDLHLPGAESS